MFKSMKNNFNFNKMKNISFYKLRMFYVLSLAFTFNITIKSYAANIPQSNNERVALFDDGWKFIREDLQGAEQKSFDDLKWQTLDLPHDWSIDDLPNQNDEKVIGPFFKDSKQAGNTGYFTGGTGWYRKHFTLTPNDKGKIINILFDGVYMDCDVWINGKLLGNHPYGYTPFYYDLTKILDFSGNENIIAVRVKNLGLNSRWYSGSGIYRHVWLVRTNPEHFTQWGTFITTPNVSEEASSVNIQTEIEFPSTKINSLELSFSILTQKGVLVSQGKTKEKIITNNKASFNKLLEIKQPDLWSTESPNLYIAKIELLIEGKVVDSEELIFGIRSIKVDAFTGLLINGKKTLLKGGCIHHDNGPLGSATFDRAEERKIEVLKSNGYNAIRTSHNPPSKQLLDACDRLGMIVLDEAFDTWNHPKNPDDYHKYFKEWWPKDLESMILRDRNHPSVIFWSIGNEIYERADSEGVEVGTKMVQLVKSIDPTRLVTEGVCSFWDHKDVKWEHSANAFAYLDLAGCNYQWNNYESDHKSYPSRVMIGTESLAYDAAENWDKVEKLPYVIGDFVWTAMDYMGETALSYNDLDSIKPLKSTWPTYYISNCGDLDIVGNKRPQSYFRDVVWDRSKIEISVHAPVPDGHKDVFRYWGWPDEYQSWNWQGNEGNKLQVSVYSRSQKVRLELNGKVIDEKTVTDSSKLTFKFQVPYSPGEIKAYAITNGEIIGTVSLKTAGKPHSIRMIADRYEISNSRNDLSYITVEILDEKGIVVPDANVLVTFSIEGQGEVAGIGNGNPKGMESFKKLKHHTFKGKCLAILRPIGKSGTIKFVAKSDGLIDTKIEIRVK